MKHDYVRVCTPPGQQKVKPANAVFKVEWYTAVEDEDSSQDAKNWFARVPCFVSRYKTRWYYISHGAFSRVCTSQPARQKTAGNFESDR